MVPETGDVFFSLLGVLRQIRTIQALDCSLRYVCSSWTLAHPVVSPRRAVAIHPQRIMYGTNTENRLPVSRLKATPPLPLLPTRGLYLHHPLFARDMVHIIIVVLVMVLVTGPPTTSLAKSTQNLAFVDYPYCWPASSPRSCRTTPTLEGFNDWGGRRYDNFVPGEVTKTAPPGDRTT